jgi:tellurite resistance protein TehA-like permease
VRPFRSRSLGGIDYLGVAMNPGPVFGFLSVLSAIVRFVLAGLAVYALVLAIIFLRLRIAELKRAVPPTSSLQD